MKKFLGAFLSFSLMMCMFSTTLYAEENVASSEETITLSEELKNDSQSNFVGAKQLQESSSETSSSETSGSETSGSETSGSETTGSETEVQTNEMVSDGIIKPISENVISVTVDGVTTDYTNYKDALERQIKGNEIVVTLNCDIDFTNEDVYSKKSETNGIYLDIGTEDANVVLDLNGHSVMNHYKNPNGTFPARGFSVSMKGGSFKVINNAATASNFDVEKLGQVKSKYSSKIIEFSFGDNISTTTKDLELKYVVSKYSDFYLGFNGGYKGLQADGSYNFYTSASDAIKNSTDHTAILVNDYTGSDGFSALSGTKGVVDLNDKSFTTLSTAFNFLYSNVDITIKNGKINALNDNCDENTPNVGFIGDPAHDVSDITLTLEKVDVVSNYYNGIDFHGTDTDLHLNLVNSTLTMQRADSYGIYMPAKDSTVNIQNSQLKAGTGIAVKGGTLNVIDSKVQSNGDEFIPNEGASSGFEETGDAIYIDGSYNFPIDVNVKNSEVTSENAKAVRDLFVDETTNNTNILTESGKFSSNISKYVPENKALLRADSSYYVGTVEEVAKEAEKAKKSVEILIGIDSIVVQEGVEVINKSGSNITVNGNIIKDNQTVIVDKVPTAAVTYSNEGNWTNKDVTVTIKASEPIKDIEGWTKVDEQTFTKVYTDNALDTLTITDMTGNTSSVNVDVKNIDKKAPEIRGLSNITLVQGSKFDPLEGVSAYDYQCGAIKEIKVTPSIDTNVVGVYELEYSVSDLAGNITTIKRTVTITAEDTTITPNEQTKPNIDKPDANKPNSNTGNPETGDQTDIGLYTLLFVMSALGVAISVVWKKKRTLENK